MSDGQEFNNAPQLRGDFLHPQQVAGWRAEMTSFLQDCLAEVQSISELLQSAGQFQSTKHETTHSRQPEPIATPEPRQPQPEPPEDTAILTSRQYDAMTTERRDIYEQPAAASHDDWQRPPSTNPPPNPASTDEADFDSRLANLKRMLAAKLTGSESSSEQ